MNVQIERLAALRKVMKEKGIDYYIVPTNDYHGSEYVGDFFKCREFITGFTGSAGTAIISLDDAGLWTDGRYFLQAEDQLKDTTVKLYKMGEAGVPTINEYLLTNAKDKTIGFDGKVLSARFVNTLKVVLRNSNVKFSYTDDLIGEIWNDRPKMSCTLAFSLDVKYVGESRASKMARTMKEVYAAGADSFLLTSLDDIAWLFNVRADDVKCNPVVLSYVLLDNDEYTFYCGEDAINESLRKELEADGIIIKNYFDIFEDIKKLGDKKVMLDSTKVNYQLYASLNQKNILDRMNVTTIFKSEKNETEIKNSYAAHLRDGVAVTKFIYWLKKNIGKMKITEVSAADYLENLRKQQEHFMGLSFDTISGYDYHGAIIHYEPTKETDIEVLPKSFLLEDSGGQYLEGTTDITRTIAMGPLTPEEIKDYTLVLKGHLALGDAKFPEGVTGIALDMLARRPLWENGLEYNHGTGHGVGYFLNVHEGPQNISYHLGRSTSSFKQGMITSDEPGIYLPNRFGIRIENLMVCLNDQVTEFGQFLKFDMLTVVPYEVEAIDKSLLDAHEIELINTYHARVYKEVSPFLTEDEKAWLKDVTKPL